MRPYAHCFLLGFFATQPGELLGLKWSDINLEAGSLRVQRTLTYINGVGFRESTPKTKSSKRTIKLASFAIEALKEHRACQLEMRLKAPAWHHPELVFSDQRDGGYINSSTVHYQFKRALERAGLPDMHVHGLRHTAATLWLSKGVPPKVVQEILGHSSIKITMDEYGHVLPGMQDMAMNTMHDIMTQPKKEAK